MKSFWVRDLDLALKRHEKDYASSGATGKTGAGLARVGLRGILAERQVRDSG